MIMKKIVIYILFLFIGASVLSCSEKYEIYNSSTDRLVFYYGKNSYGQVLTDSLQTKSFAFDHSSVTETTVWLEVRTMGFVSDKDRVFEVEQENVPEIYNAVSGTHYVPFDSPEVNKFLVIPAGQVSAKFPVILKRDASLLENKATLKLRIKANENFQLGYSNKQVAIIEFADILLKPKYWDGQASYYFAGQYSYEKFRFMVDVATWTLDDAWFEKNFKDASVVEMGYATFISDYFVTALKDENKRRKDVLKLGVLMEKFGDGLRPIHFTKYRVDQPNEW